MALKDPGCVSNILTDLDVVFLRIFVSHETLVTGARDLQKRNAQPQVQGSNLGY
jgi:hypothetical protein